MMNSNKGYKKVYAILLVIAVIIGLIPYGAFAYEIDGNTYVRVIIVFEEDDEYATYNLKDEKANEYIMYYIENTVMKKPRYSFKGWKKVGEDGIFDFKNRVLTEDSRFEPVWEEILPSRFINVFLHGKSDIIPLSANLGFAIKVQGNGKTGIYSFNDSLTYSEEEHLGSYLGRNVLRYSIDEKDPLLHYLKNEYMQNHFGDLIITDSSLSQRIKTLMEYLGHNTDDYKNMEIEIEYERIDPPPSEVRSLILHFLPKKLDVYFDSNGGSDLEVMKLEYNSYIPKVENPVKQGYEFMGWYHGDTKWDFDYRDEPGLYSTKFRVINNMDLKAKWIKINDTEDNNTGGIIEYNPGSEKKEIEKEGTEKKEESNNSQENNLVKKSLDSNNTIDDLFFPSPENWTIGEDLTPLGIENGEFLTYIHGYEDKMMRAERVLSREEAAAIIFRLIEPNYRDILRSFDNNFRDIDKRAWSNKHISSLVSGKLLNGYKDGTFRPKSGLTRAELAVLLSKLYNLKPEENHGFEDIKGHWAGKT